MTGKRLRGRRRVKKMADTGPGAVEPLAEPVLEQVDLGPPPEGDDEGLRESLEVALPGTSDQHQPMPEQQFPGAMTKADARTAVTAALNHAALFTGQLEFLAARLPLGSRHRTAVENARRLTGQCYNALAAAAGLLGLSDG